ncbi:hypothetical protein [Legionella sp. CNM-4043-24]|uniref:hypothetical protein n=1 Tax=Legionella sp. CNM-4043-24 TaxID=3421646 RepID=UPI00403AA4E9
MKRYITVLLLLISINSFSEIIQIQGPYQGIINHIFFLDDLQKIGFISTANGLYKTINGGENWFSINGNLPFQTYVPSGYIYSYTRPVKMIQTNDGNVIYALYSPGQWESQIFVTKDGGYSWSKVIVPKPISANYMKLTNNNELILYDGYCLYKGNFSNDNFEEKSCPNGDAIDYVNENLIYASPSHKNPLEGFKKSIDGGKTWVNMSSFGRNLGAPYSKIDATEYAVYILIDDSVGQILVKSINAGLTWETIYISSETDKYKKRITLISHDRNYEYIGFSDGYVYRIENNKTDLELYLQPGYGVSKYKNISNAVKTVNLNEKFFIGTGFGLYKQYLNIDNEVVSDPFFEANGFASKNIFKTNNSRTIFSMQYPQNGLYNSKIKSLLFRSQDDGLTWEKIKVDDAVRIYSFFSSEPNVIYLISSDKDGYISLLKSSDNGDSWIKLRNLKSAMCDSKSIKVESERIYCTTSGIYTSLNIENDDVHNINLPVERLPYGNMAFNNENDIVVLTINGLFKSDDKGVSWRFLGKLDQQDKCYNILSSFKYPQITNKSCTYINEDKIIKIFNDNNNLTIETLTRFGSIYASRRNDIKTIPNSCQKNARCDINFQVVFKSESELYVLFQSTIYKSMDGGVTWNKMIHFTEIFKTIFNLEIDGSQGYFISDGDQIYSKGIFKFDLEGI